MKLIPWKVQKNIILFPKKWNKSQVMDWLNAKYIRVCPICSKVDVSYTHFNDCSDVKK
jgi:capsid portal protein